MSNAPLRTRTVVRFLVMALGLTRSDAIQGSEDCRRSLSVSQVLRTAQQLDGKVVCVRGVIALNSERQGEFATTEEMVSLEHAQQGDLQKNAVGLIDWDKETGITGDLYKPDTFAQIERMASSQSSGPQSRCLLDVTVRAGVMYKKRLLEKARKVASHTAGVGLIKGPQRDVELVLLEVVKVNRKLPLKPTSAR